MASAAGQRAIIATAATAAVLAAVSHAGRFHQWLDLAAHFAPFYLAIGLLTGLLTARQARGRRFVTGLASAVAVVASALLIAPELAASDQPRVRRDAAGQVKIVHLKAPGSAGGEPLISWLLGEDADFIMVTNASHAFRDRLRTRGWAVAGSGGNLMIFTRAPYVRMSRPRSREPVWFVNATYEGEAGEIEAVIAHLGWPTEAAATEQAAALQQVIGELPRERMILAGDLNATPWSFRLRRLDQGLGLARRTRALPTWPATVFGVAWPWPVLPIDHVYAGDGWATVDVRRGPPLGLEHYPLVVTLAPAPGGRARGTGR